MSIELIWTPQVPNGMDRANRNRLLQINPDPYTSATHTKGMARITFKENDGTVTKIETYAGDFENHELVNGVFTITGPGQQRRELQTDPRGDPIPLSIQRPPTPTRPPTPPTPPRPRRGSRHFPLQ